MVVASSIYLMCYDVVCISSIILDVIALGRISWWIDKWWEGIMYVFDVFF
jgi:hypothetical protein